MCYCLCAPGVGVDRLRRISRGAAMWQAEQVWVCSLPGPMLQPHICYAAGYSLARLEMKALHAVECDVKSRMPRLPSCFGPAANPQRLGLTGRIIHRRERAGEGGIELTAPQGRHSWLSVRHGMPKPWTLISPDSTVRTHLPTPCRS